MANARNGAWGGSGGDGTATLLSTGRRYNVIADFGAIADGIADDTSAIDEAAGAVAQVGGELYFPAGSYRYSGVGLSFDPSGSTPVVLRGDGQQATRITFVSVSGSQCVLMDAQGGVGSASSVGGGIEDLAMTFPAAKNGIVVRGRESFRLQHLYLYSGATAVTLDESRLGQISHVFADQYTVNGINVLGDTFSYNWFSDLQLNGTPSCTGWGVNFVATLSPAGAGIYLERVIVNSGGQGGFRFEYTGGSPPASMWVFLSDCVADGVFGNDAFLFKKVNAVFVTNSHAVNHGSGKAGFAYDACTQVSQVGGVAYTSTGTNGDIWLRNACSSVSIVGVLTTGTTTAFRTDATTHTNVHIDCPATLSPSASNDLSKLQSKSQARSLAYRSTAQGIANATWVAVSWDANVYDFGPIHSTSTNPTRFTAPATGTYRATAFVRVQSNATGDRYIRAIKNAATVLIVKVVDATGSDETCLDVSVSVDMNASDYIEFQVHQTSGVSLNIGGTRETCHASLEAIKTF